MKIIASVFGDEELYSSQHDVDSILRAHHSHVGKEILCSSLQQGIRFGVFKTLRVRSISNNEHVRWLPAASANRDLATFFIYDHHHTGAGIGDPFEEMENRDNNSLFNARAMHCIDFGRKVVLVEDDLFAKESEG